MNPNFSIDARVMVSALVMAIGAGIVAGLAPALMACRADVAASLKSARGATEGAGTRIRSALVVAQVALSLTLLVSGGLFLRSLDRAKSVDLGFKPEGMFLASTGPGLQGYDFSQRLAFYKGVRDRIASLPGVDHAAWISWPPLGIIGEIAIISPDVRPSDDPDWRPPIAMEVDISPEYFVTSGMRLLDGRLFDERDDAVTTRVTIVNQTLAAAFWPGQSPLGRSFTADGRRLEVVGVVSNAKYRNVGETPQAALYKPLSQASPMFATIAIRTSRAPSELAPAVRQAIRQIDPDVSVYDVRSMSAHLDNGQAFFVFRLAALMTGLFGGMGVLLAAVGLYGMVAYHVSQRTQEIGVRMALGAGAADIIREVLARGARFAAIGIVVGVVLSAGLARLMKGMLLGVSPFDPLTYAAVAALLIAICLVASFVPARRATAVDPLIALRAE
jgi:predicted permease